jgi:hypothetical protein
MVRSVQSSPYGVVDYLYYNSILLNVDGCGVVNVSGYVWARYKCSLIVLCFLVNTRLAEVFL